MHPSHLSELSNYLPAVVKDYPSGMLVEYYVLDPSTDTMVRRRVRLQRLVKRIQGKRNKLLAAQQVADTLNAKLRGGWTPLHVTEDSRLYTRLPVLQERFLTGKRAEGCREATMVQYKSVLDIWMRWCEDNGHAGTYSGAYLRPAAVRYMDDVLQLGNRHRSYNNTLKVMKAFWQWSLEHCYCKENPFMGIKMLKKEPKLRILIPAEDRRRIAEYYAAERPPMGIVCQLVYSSAIRPAEILKIQLKHVRLDRHYIVIPGENAKNHHERHATLTPALEELLQPVVAAHRDGELFLFGKGGNLEPDREPANKSYFQKSWERMRKALGLPKEMQLYSLRDTGITDLLHAGVDPLTVQHHADHSSLAIQGIYTAHHDPGLTEKIYRSAPAF